VSDSGCAGGRRGSGTGVGGAAGCEAEDAEGHLGDGEVGRAGEAVELVPVDGDGDGRALAGAGGIGGDGVGAADVAQVVNEDLRQADYEAFRALAPAFAEAKLAAPHTWHTAEMFLLLQELQA